MREHTRLADRADRWLVSNRSKDHLLGGTALSDAEEWLASKPESSPALSKIQIEFIVSSQKNSRSRYRKFIATAFLVCVAATSAAIYSWQQRNAALIGQSRTLASIAEDRTQAGDQTAAANIAIDALPLNGAIWERPIASQAVVALHNSLFSMPERRVHYDQTDKVNSLSVDPERRMVASGSDDHTVALRSAVDSGPAKILKGHTGPVEIVRWAPNGSLLASGSGDGAVKVWDAATGGLVKNLDGLRSSVIALNFDRNGGHVIGGATDGGAIIWSLDGHAIPLDGHSKRVNTAEFSPVDPWALTSSDDATVKLWDTASGKLIRTFQADDQAVVGASFAAERTQLIAWSFDGAIRVWSIAEGSSSTVLGHDGPIRFLRFCEIGDCFVTGGDDGLVKVWARKSLSLINSINTNDSVWSGDVAGVLVAAATRAGKIVVLNYANGNAIRTLLGHSDWVYDVAFSDAHPTAIFSASRDGTVREWSLFSSPLTQQIKAHDATIYSYRFSRDGSQLVTASADGSWKRWSSSDLEHVASGRTKGEVLDAAIDTERNIVATVDSTNQLSIFDATTGARLAGWVPGKSEPLVVLIDRLGNVITGSADGVLRTWDVKSGALKAEKKVHERDITCLDASPSVPLIITCSLDGSAAVHSLSTDKKVILRGHTKAIRSATFSADGKTAITASEDSVLRIWNVETGTLSASVPIEAAGGLADASVSSDQKYLLAVGLDGTIRVIDNMRGYAIAEYSGHLDTVAQAKFANRRSVISVSVDGYMHRWSVLDGPKWAAEATKLLPRCLNASQRQMLSLSPSPPSYCHSKDIQ